MKIKPCPFCEGQAIVDSIKISLTHKDYWVECNNDECDVCPETETFSSPEKAINAWNTRTESLWISVNDRLPEIPEGNHAVSVLCSVHDPEYEEIRPGYGSKTYTGVSWDGEKFKTLGLGGNGKWYWFELIDIVTHWMYIPEPFQITDPGFSFDPKGYTGYLPVEKS